MDFGESSLSCAINLEWLDKQGCVQRKITQKKALVRIVRNEFRDIFIVVSGEKSLPVKFQLNNINVHNKFMSEGKASIKFQECNCTLFISNAPPSTLMVFLRTILVKMTGEKDNTPSSRQSLRSQLLSGKTKSLDEISPVTIAELNKTKVRVTKASATTPSPPNAKKRKLTDKNIKVPAAKKLYSQSALTYAILELNEEQKEVLRACHAGKNIFFTGSAGTGKSFLLRKIISAFPPDITCATASTGVAACHIGGTTLHAFAGIGSGDANLEQCIKLASRPGILTNWKRCKHLIIDEISMVDGKYFEKIEAVARRIRNNDKPFGGIQLILCGDFFQLPPVVKQNENKLSTTKRFCFQTSAWDRCIQICFELRQVHRQKDPEFIDILNKVRIGYISPEIADKLLATSKQKIEQDGILATRLCSHTNDANLINSHKLNSLPGKLKISNAQDSDASVTKQLDQVTAVPSKLELKIGAQVMLLKNININDGLVNGARGIIVNFHESLPVVKFLNGKEYTVKYEKWIVKTATGTTISRKQLPLSLAWAFSIHKSQGLTLDCVEMSLSKVFESGQAYVALSRAKSLETLRILDFDVKQVWANPDVLEFYKKFRRKIQQNQFFPLGKKLSHNLV